MRTDLNWCRVSRQNLCPICHKPDWCLISIDGQACICARIKSANQAGYAGWLHRLCQTIPFLHTLPELQRPRSTSELPRGSAQVCDRAYRALLAHLQLSDVHHHNLLSRGMTSHQIAELMYSSLPVSGRPSIVSQLVASGIKMSGVPGFYLDAGEVRLAGPAGMLIPIRDLQGRIIGLQVRCDNTKTGKYKWISSHGKPFGCSSGSPIHVARPAHIQSDEIWITEGALKADIASLRLNRLFLAISGVSNWRGILPLINTIKPDRVVVCFDMDKNQNQVVRFHLDALISSLVRRGVSTFEADWDSRFKGIDDFLTEAC